ncbi:uncharacterized protein KQ657_003960 [Scheffersomyces spartinae]|uniref:SMP-LTD domain-containing protein n=1 Tax=Scheffersomyces spartinae TaxID=45513 RepID=A0A9P7VC88_9ASCO|nr:uncharacterized protein KQ657_003960 [Scheffersomyces spartinae]KAG7194856.1 hypothetical protein KQ657_003960 [Scheffersomyces spartinae]
MSFSQFLIAYFLGGLTLIPIVIICFIYLHPRDERTQTDRLIADQEEGLKAGAIEEDKSTGIEAFHSGWIFVTQTYLESQDEINSSTISIESDSKSAYSSLYKLQQKQQKQEEDLNEEFEDNSNAIPPSCNASNLELNGSSNNFANAGSSGKSTGLSASSTSASIAPVNASSSASSISSASTTPYAAAAGATSSPSSSSSSRTNGSSSNLRPSQRKHRYYAVLKHGNLFLYKDEKLKEVKHVIVLSSYLVTLWPRNLTDAQLFTKRTAICLMKRDWIRPRRLSDNFETFDKDKISVMDVLYPNSTLSPPKGSFFIYDDLNIDKEDWYFELIKATKISSKFNMDLLNPLVHANTMHFETRNMINLIQTLYSSEGHLQTKWLNAMIGRLFLAFQKTDVLKEFLIQRIYKKLNKIKVPGFLDKFQIVKVFPGNSAPFFTHPHLKEISPDGSILMSTFVSYSGQLSLQIATKLTINLGFKPREVDVLLSITLELLEGTVLFKIKPPPSERIWYSFEVEPVLQLKIEPIISSRQLTYNIITNQIDKKFKEAIRESLVLPHWDDLVFFDTKDYIYRGGIWENPKPFEERESDKENDSNSVHRSSTSIGEALDEDAIDSSPPESVRLIQTNSSQMTTKMKLSATLSDFSKRLKKTKSTHTLSVNEENYLNDGSTLNSPDSNKQNNPTMSTLKKIGQWYFKDNNKNNNETDSQGSFHFKKASTDSSSLGEGIEDSCSITGVASSTSSGAASKDYNPPEMISSRRKKSDRKPSISQVATTPSVSASLPHSYEFAKSPEQTHTVLKTLSILSGNPYEFDDNINIPEMEYSDGQATVGVTQATTTSFNQSVSLHSSKPAPPSYSLEDFPFISKPDQRPVLSPRAPTDNLIGTPTKPYRKPPPPSSPRILENSFD